jgi:hypothetical protein
VKVTAEDVRLPEAVQLEFPQWLSNWTIFLEISITSRVASNNLKDLLIENYNSTVILEKRRSSDRLCWRFFMLFFYDLEQLIITSIYQKNLDEIIKLMKTDAVGESEEDIHKNFKKWIKFGLRYYCLVSSLGNPGCLFLLPESIGDHL